MSASGAGLNRSTQYFLLNGMMECLQVKQKYLRGIGTAEKTELWDRWQHGESLKAIRRAIGKPSSSIYLKLALYGGIRPAPQSRSRLSLSLSEREAI